MSSVSGDGRQKMVAPVPGCLPSTVCVCDVRCIASLLGRGSGTDVDGSKYSYKAE